MSPLSETNHTVDEEQARSPCGHGHDHSSDHAPSHAHSHAEAKVAAPAPQKPLNGGERTVFLIAQMDCPTEEALIRKKLSAMPSVHNVQFNLMQRLLTVDHSPLEREAIAQAIRSLGFTAELPESAPQGGTAASARKSAHWPLALACAAAVASEIVSFAAFPGWIAASLAVLAVIAGGLGTYKKGWVAIRNGNLNINALMSIAVTGALVLGQWPEAAMVMVLFSLAELIEAKSLDRARNAVQKLMQLAPERATVQQPDGTWQDVDAKSVSINAVVRLKPGERIGLDGVVSAGRSTVNQAPITGESLPVDKAPGDTVFAGTINESGSIEYRVTALASDTTLARIIHAVSEAQGSKAPTQRFVDQFARIYTPVVFALAVLVAVLPPLLLGGVWHDWIYKALVLLVIACPCALVISTPVTIVSGLTAAARKGILIKGGSYLEQGRKLTWLALDKTGTITHGTPAQTDVEALADTDINRCRQLAVSLAGRSDHPVSQALARAANADNISHLPVDEFEALPGRGVQGTIDGRPYALGNHRLVEGLGRCSASLEARLDTLERNGKTVVLLIGEEGVLALFAVADTVKESSRAAIGDLHALGVRTVMLSGDNSHTVAAIAKAVGIDEARGDQLPADKLTAMAEAVAKRAADGAAAGMVGDGINDAPALARADIGFAMGALGADTAIETADVALMDDDLRKIPAFIRLSKATHAVLIQNIVLALGIKAVFFVLALTGAGTLWMAVLADVGASLLVVANGLRLLRR
uniref:heavy metal translocating P-type ATPase n=1 Tax=Caballeronia sp. LjRoot34 TaxID=3342325 RepID=UPI003F505BB1